MTLTSENNHMEAVGNEIHLVDAVGQLLAIIPLKTAKVIGVFVKDHTRAHMKYEESSGRDGPFFTSGEGADDLGYRGDSAKDTPLDLARSMGGSLIVGVFGK